MILCPYCGSRKHYVRGNPKTDENNTHLRKRECSVCDNLFITAERIETRPLNVIKSNGRREPFDRKKVLKSLVLAFSKCQIDNERIDSLADGIVRQLEASAESEVESEAIGELVLDTLNAVDLTAYVRYASIFRGFRDIKEFETLINDLIE